MMSMMNEIGSFLLSCLHLADQSLSAFNRTTVKARSKACARQITEEVRAAQAALNDPVALEWHIANIGYALRDMQTDDLALIALENNVDVIEARYLLAIPGINKSDVRIIDYINAAQRHILTVFTEYHSADKASKRLGLEIGELHSALLDETIPKPAAEKSPDGVKRFNFDRKWFDAAKAALERKGSPEGNDSSTEGSNALEGEDLRAVVPPEQVGPIRLEVTNGKLAIASQPADPLAGAAVNVRAAVDDLISSGRHIVEELKYTNAEKRLTAAAEYLQVHLESEINITQLALTNMRFEMIYLSVENEISSTLLAMLKAQTMAIGMYVGQFSEWHSFVENAASANLTRATIEDIQTATERVLERIAENKDIVDEEVPVSINMILSFSRSPSLSSKKAAFALLLTLEEFVRRTYSYAADFLDKTITKSSDRASGVISKGVAAGLISLGIFVAANMSGPVAQVGQSWVKIAKQVGEQALKELTDK